MLNCLGEGEYSPIMKHFLKRFPAGADRFAGVETFTASNGARVYLPAWTHADWPAALQCPLQVLPHSRA